MNFKCPGQDSRFLKCEEIECPGCAYMVEVFSDEVKAVCPKCKIKFLRKRLPSCADWCKFAVDCLGEEKFKELKSQER